MDEQLEQDLPLSKTKLKKLAKEVEGLARQLTELSEQALGHLDLDEDLHTEVAIARETVGRGSHKRQIKHLAGFMRQQPEEVLRIKDALEAQDQVALGERRQFHKLEDLRDRLCEQATFQDAFDEVVGLCPNIERKTIARLARSVQQHADKRAARELFRRLRDELTD